MIERKTRLAPFYDHARGIWHCYFEPEEPSDAPYAFWLGKYEPDTVVLKTQRFTVIGSGGGVIGSGGGGTWNTWSMGG